MTPLPNGSPTAAELDRAMVGEAAYHEAVDGGMGHDDALAVAKAAMTAHHRKQVLRSVGVDLDG